MTSIALFSSSAHLEMVRKVFGHAAATITAVVLLSAAALKLHQLATIPPFSHAWLDSRWLGAVLIDVEFLLAAWLISGWRRRTARRLVNCVFAVFGVYALTRALSGDKSCGCFGVIQVNPWITAAFDLVLASLLYWSRGFTRQFSPKKLHLAIVASCAALAVAGCTVIATNSAKETQTVDSEKVLIDPSRKLVVLEPDSWKGRPFPLALFIDVGPRLMSGDWVVVLYHADCEDCRKAIPRYEQTAEAGALENGVGVAFIAISEYDRQAAYSFFHSSIPVHGQLASSHDWFATTPVALRLSSGKVTMVASGKAAVDPSWIEK